MNPKSKLIFVFAAGALIGAAIASLLTTGKGKELAGKARKKMNDLGDDVKENVSKLENDILEALKNNGKKENPRT